MMNNKQIDVDVLRLIAENLESKLASIGISGYVSGISPGIVDSVYSVKFTNESKVDPNDVAKSLSISLSKTVSIEVYDANGIKIKISNENIIDKDDSEVDDELYSSAIKLVSKDKESSISLVQKEFKVGYNRATSLVETIMRMN